MVGKGERFRKELQKSTPIPVCLDAVETEKSNISLRITYFLLFCFPENEEEDQHTSKVLIFYFHTFPQQPQGPTMSKAPTQISHFHKTHDAYQETEFLPHFLHSLMHQMKHNIINELNFHAKSTAQMAICHPRVRKLFILLIFPAFSSVEADPEKSNQGPSSWGNNKRSIHAKSFSRVQNIKVKQISSSLVESSIQNHKLEIVIPPFKRQKLQLSPACTQQPNGSKTSGTPKKVSPFPAKKKKQTNQTHMQCNSTQVHTTKFKYFL